MTNQNGSFLPGFEEPSPMERFPGRIVHCKKEKYDIYIGRPGPFGNPYVIGKDGTRDEVIEKFEHYARSNPELMEKIHREIPGKVLGCWCGTKRCHGEILIKIANEAPDIAPADDGDKGTERRYVPSQGD